jgi:cyclic pyranopterin phosphate synthase
MPPVFGKVDMLTDQFQRRFYYLRLSITDACNFKCQYCLPDGYQSSCSDDFLSLSEIKPLVSTFARLGTRKIRITGGEPTLRKDLPEIIETCAQTSGISTIAMTTNGFKLATHALRWRDAGLNQVNISLDSLDARQFNSITGTRSFDRVMAGIDAAVDAGFEAVKVNAVLTKTVDAKAIAAFLDWIKTRPIEVRFIELMQTGQHQDFFNENHISGQSLKQMLLASGWTAQINRCDAGPAQVMRHPDYLGRVGLILPYESGFCDTCNRLRVSSTGKLHLCLFGEQGVSLREHIHQSDELESVIGLALKEKRVSHLLKQGETGMTPHLASIGG